MLLFQLCLAIGVFLAASTSNAELSPAAYQELKDEASEVLSINATNIADVTGETDGDNCTLFFLVDAVVLDVNRSALGLAVNQEIQLEAYTRDQTLAECEVFLGPGAPPLLENGWCGLAYLNPSEDSDILEPAAFGQSFEEYSAAQCQAIAEAGTTEENNPKETTSGGKIISTCLMGLVSLSVVVQLLAW